MLDILAATTPIAQCQITQSAIQSQADRWLRGFFLEGPNQMAGGGRLLRPEAFHHVICDFVFEVLVAEMDFVLEEGIHARARRDAL